MIPKRMGRVAYGVCMAFLLPPAVVFSAIGGLHLQLIAMILGVAVLGVTALRIHDINQSGWWSLLLFLPVGHVFVILALLGWPGTRAENRFGPVPRF